MKRFLLSILVLLFLGESVSLAKLTHRERKADDKADQFLEGQDRHIDLAVLLHVVKRDPNGTVHLPGLPPLSIVRSHRRGAIYDTLTRKFVGKCPDERRLVLYCSEQQERAILHGEQMPPGVWMQGGKGSGKSSAGCIWLTLQIIKHAERPLKGAGVTSPVGRRMEAIRKILVGPKNEDGERKGGMWPTNWYAWREGDQVAYVRTGLSIDFVSAHVSSESEGSPIQGQNWAIWLGDEIQDYYSAFIEILMRGRAGWEGRFEMCATATPKNDSGYRDFRDQIAVNADWSVHLMRGPDSPFVDPKQWERVARATTDDQYRREALGEDVLSPNRLYFKWEREHNVRTLPQVPRWEDVTARELARFAPRGMRFDVLVGSDPGRIVNVSVLLKAYQPPIPQATRQNPRPAMPLPVWFVVGEVNTPRSTNEEHVRKLVHELQRRWGCNLGGDGPQAFVRMDPMARGENDSEHPAPEVRKTYNAMGLYTRSAAYKPGSVDDALVPREARIDMINALLCNGLGERRLFVQCDDAKVIAAPKLVDAFERQEDKTERLLKGTERDFTHWTHALSYALWAIEKPRIDAAWRAA